MSSISTDHSSEAPMEPSAFLKKTYAILMDKSNHQIINWSSCGTRFSILDQERFASEILPKHFKHNNPKSFVRQLNIHGFKKYSGKAEKGRDYYNESFIRGKPDLLKKIVRLSVKRKEEVPESKEVLEQLEKENKCLKSKVLVLETTKASIDGCSDTECPDVEQTRRLLQALQVYTKIDRLEKSGSDIDPRERELYLKTKDLLATVTLLQSSSSQGDAELGKRSVHSEGKELSLPESDHSDTDSLFQLDFPQDPFSDSFSVREFDFDFCN